MKIVRRTNRKTGTKTQTVEVAADKVNIHLREYDFGHGPAADDYTLAVHPTLAAEIKADYIDRGAAPFVVVKMGHRGDYAVKTFLSVEQAETLRDQLIETLAAAAAEVSA